MYLLFIIFPLAFAPSAGNLFTREESVRPQGICPPVYKIHSYYENCSASAEYFFNDANRGNFS